MRLFSYAVLIALLAACGAGARGGCPSLTRRLA
jgi:hypothetical protein